MLFRDELEAVLARFNPWMSADAVRQVIEKLDAIPPTVEGNREMLGWLRGERPHLGLRVGARDRPSAPGRARPLKGLDTR